MVRRCSPMFIAAPLFSPQRVSITEHGTGPLGLATDRWPFLARLGDCVQPPHRLGGQASREIRGSNISVPGAPVCGLGTLSADRQGIRHKVWQIDRMWMA